MAENDSLRFGNVVNLYYETLQVKMPKQLDLFAEWLPSFLISEIPTNDEIKKEAEYDDRAFLIHAVKYHGSFYAGGSKRISQITGRLMGTAKGNQEKERKTAEMIQKHVAWLLTANMDCMAQLKTNTENKIAQLNEHQLNDFADQIFDYLEQITKHRTHMEEYDQLNELFPMDDEVYESICLYAARQLRRNDQEGVVNAYLWLLLGAFLRNEAGRVTRMYDSFVTPANRYSSETMNLYEKVYAVLYPEEYEDVYYGDDLDQRFPGIDWKCDGCGDYLNAQPGFDDHLDIWQCRKCGYLNRISIDEIYENEEDFLNHQKPVDQDRFFQAIETRKKERN